MGAVTRLAQHNKELMAEMGRAIMAKVKGNKMAEAAMAVTQRQRADPRQGACRPGALLDKPEDDT